MASRKPDFQITMPEREPWGIARPSSASRSPRSPRFHEDFNAPFSETLMNASRTTLSTDASGFLSPQPSPSLEGESRRPYSSNAAQSVQHIQPSAPPQWREVQWTSESNHRASVNDRIRNWAKRSLVMVRNRSEAPDDNMSINHRRSKKNALHRHTQAYDPDDLPSFDTDDRYCHASITIRKVSDST